MNQLHQKSNRYEFMNQLRTKQNYYLICLDIVDFKQINEKYRFENGDFVLLQIINRIRDLKEMTRSLAVCRYDADLILIAVERATEAEVITLMNAVINYSYKYPLVFRAGYQHISNEHQFKHFFESVTYVIKYAKFCVAHSADQTHDLAGDIATYFAIKQDLTEQQGKYFQLVYQPKIASASQSVHSCEVLSRWVHPKVGVTMPDQFLPIIQHLNQEFAFDRLIFEKACQELSEDSSIPAVFSINICLQSLIQSDFWEFALNCAQKYRIPAQQITIEIIENVCEQNHEAVIANIQNLTAQGFRISIDDFGTGYSSYARLAAINFCEVKIPREFLLLEANNDQQRNQLILAGIISLCKVLDCEIVIEGVETPANVTLAQELGIDYLQGYYYSKPLPKQAYATFLANNPRNAE